MNNVLDFGAIGNAVADDTLAIQNAISAGGEIFIPNGDYRITKTLKVGSNTKIVAEDCARLFQCETVEKHRGDFLITNSDHENGNVNISISGGIWDGNYDGLNNSKPADIFDENAWSGALINFFNVKQLKLAHMEFANSVAYNLRLGKIDGFEFDDFRFTSKQRASNQDGIHFGGECYNGIVTNMRAVTKGQTNDDFIALNADDCIYRLENRDLTRGNIENITFKNLYANDCHTGIRFLSVTSSIKNIKFENVQFGCRELAINMDGARYCRTPLFQEDEFPLGCGNIENVTIDGLKIYITEPKRRNPFICCETRLKNFEIKNFKRLYEKEQENVRKTLVIGKTTNTSLICNGKTYSVTEKTDRLEVDDLN